MAPAVPSASGGRPLAPPLGPVPAPSIKSEQGADGSATARSTPQSACSEGLHCPKEAVAVRWDQPIARLMVLHLPSHINTRMGGRWRRLLSDVRGPGNPVAAPEPAGRTVVGTSGTER